MLLRQLLVLIAALWTSAALAQDVPAMTDAERAAFRAEVRAYLLDNPEVLMEAIAVLEQRQAEAGSANDLAMVQEFAEQIRNDGYSWVGGNPEGDITLVEFMDYRCGYCRRAFDAVNTLVADDGNIRFVIKEFPILGEQSTLSAQFAIAVHQLHGDDAYKLVHDALMTLQTDVTPDVLTRLSETLGYDSAPILDRMVGPEVATVIAANRALAQQLQISGTPTFLFEDTMVRGYVPLEQMQAMVDQLRIE